MGDGVAGEKGGVDDQTDRRVPGKSADVSDPRLDMI